MHYSEGYSNLTSLLAFLCIHHWRGVEGVEISICVPQKVSLCTASYPEMSPGLCFVSDAGTSEIKEYQNKK
jgi:hypothetical protein